MIRKVYHRSCRVKSVGCFERHWPNMVITPPQTNQIAYISLYNANQPFRMLVRQHLPSYVGTSYHYKQVAETTKVCKDLKGATKLKLNLQVILLVCLHLMWACVNSMFPEVSFKLLYCELIKIDFEKYKMLEIFNFLWK